MKLMEKALARLGIAPRPMFDLGLPLMSARAILTATKLGIFDKLSDHRLSVPELARELNANERGISILVEALAAVGYLKREGISYKNAGVAQKWLNSRSPTYLGNMAKHFDDLWTFWGGLGEAVTTGKPPIDAYQYFREHSEAQRNFILGNKDIAVFCAGEMISKIRVPPGAKKLLDLGGAHGYYSVQFCRKYPQLTSLVLDWQEPVEIGQEVVKQEGLLNRVRFKVGNYITDDIGCGYDIVLMFALLHADSPETNLSTVRKVYSALNPGGVVAISDTLSYKGKKESQIGLLFALNMLVCTPNGQTYSYDQVKDWLEEAGFTNFKRVDLRRLPGYSLVMATKPA